MPLIVKVHWAEHERGWGSRPDGCTLHLSKIDANEFIKEYWDRQPDETPYEYSAPGS